MGTAQVKEMEDGMACTRTVMPTPPRAAFPYWEKEQYAYPYLYRFWPELTWA